MEIKIDKGVPLESRSTKYPFSQMEVGDSFFVPNISAAKLVNASAYQRLKGRKFTTRTFEENGVTGARIWRVK